MFYILRIGTFYLESKLNLLYFKLKHRKVTKFKNRNIMEKLHRCIYPKIFRACSGGRKMFICKFGCFFVNKELSTE